jgi:adenylate cyclase
MNKVLRSKLINFLKNPQNLDFGILAVAFLIIYIAVYPLAQSAEMFVYDIMIKVYIGATAKKQAVSDDRIVLVVIDDKSLEDIGRWPWPRKKYIEMFDYIQNQGKAKVIAFDSFIRSRDTWNPESDEYFFSQLKEYPTVRMGLVFEQVKSLTTEEKQNIKHIKKFALKNVKDTRKHSTIMGTYALKFTPIKELVQNVDGMGSVLTPPDEDKKIRKIPYLYHSEGFYFPSLSLSAVLKFFDLEKTNIVVTKDNINIEAPGYETHIPIEKTYHYYSNTEEEATQTLFKSIINLPSRVKAFFGNKKLYYKTWIKWYKPINDSNLTHQWVSASKVLKSRESILKGEEPELDAAFFKDKIVIIGSIATGTSTAGIHDIKATPLFSHQPGVDIQATAIDNLLNNDYMYKVSKEINLFILLVFILIIIMLSFKSLDIKEALLAVLIMAMFYFVVVFYVLYPKNIVVDTVTPLVYLCITPLIIYTFQYFIERRKRGQIQNVFSKFVSSEIMGEILKAPDNVDLGGARAEVTILFSDIRGFTTMSEQLPPEEVSKTLIEYFEIMEPIIKNNQGTVDNYMGDAIMAIFGAPVHYEDHALQAVKAAVEMQQEHKKLQEKRKKQGKQAFEMGIGINTGYTFLGYVGSKNLMHYTAIGDAVNIASRLEQLNKIFNTRVIISQFTYENVRNYVEVRALKKENIRGRVEPVMLYELKGVRNLKDLII